ncbi:activator of basal transcription 1-like [Euwallacea fornicatus]|uniref:activator of basal transcription 1-like n=1 Tax=Euwallacea fornicatus TaxID=995702 RepID=UPI00338FC0CB
MAKKFTEGWVEFDEKCVAKRVAALLNNTQISTRKKSKRYDYMWNMKYLSNFKRTHLHERLTYEKLEKNKRLRGDIQLSKKKTNFFDLNVNKKDKGSINKEYENVGEILNDAAMGVEEEPKESREEVFQSLLC